MVWLVVIKLLLWIKKSAYSINVSSRANQLEK